MENNADYEKMNSITNEILQLFADKQVNAFEAAIISQMLVDIASIEFVKEYGEKGKPFLYRLKKEVSKSVKVNSPKS